MADPTSAGCGFATDAELRGRTISPGGPISPEAQGYRNPGATPNMRGVEANTDPDKGDVFDLPEMLTAGRHGAIDGDPADLINSGDAGKTYEAGVDTPSSERRSSDFPTQGQRDWGTSDHHEGGADV